MTAAGVDKGECPAGSGRPAGHPRENTLAVGDSENDRAMLEKAGVAAVMANGMPQIKAIGSIVSEADCDHDGVAELFGRLGVFEQTGQNSPAFQVIRHFCAMYTSSYAKHCAC